MSSTHAIRRLRRSVVFLAAAALAAAGVVASPVAVADTGQPWLNPDQTPQARADELLAAMTLADKVNMLHGVDTSTAPIPTVGFIPAIPRLNVPAITMTDGPAGVRDGRDKSTELPSPSAEAASFDTNVAQLYGSVLGGDARDLGQDQVFGPGMNIQRVPVNGRDFEYYSEDPFLSGTIGGADVRGIQSQGVIATVKHYVGNNQETNRMSISDKMDDRTLHEIYEKNFGVAVADGDPGAVMCSYNQINGSFSCDNSETLGSLRSQFGFDGYVVSDYPATHATTSIADGLNVELPTGVFNTLANVRAALANGSITMAEIDARVRETLIVLFRFGFFDHSFTRQPIDQAADDAAAQRIEDDSAVLLRDQGSVLPITGKDTNIAVIGAPAKTSAQGGGSSQVNPLSVDDALDAITARAGAAATVSFADGSDLTQAAATARAADVALVFVRDNESEGSDRTSLTLPNNQDALVEAVAAANPRTVVVLQTGSAVLMPWLSQVSGVLQTWYPGARGGAATAQLLFGDVDPSGKLPQTWPAAEHQVPASTPAQFPGAGGVADYSEGIYVGYRWYDEFHQTPLFPFGYGLSYTSFRYGDLKLKHGDGDSGDPVTLSFTVTNTGHVAGAEAPQVYVAKPDRLADTPPKELGAFTKVSLQPGQSRTVTLTIDPRELSYWDSGAQAFTVQDGTYRIMVGGSSASLPLSATYQVRKTDNPVQELVGSLPSVVTPGTTADLTVKVLNQSDFALRNATVAANLPAGWTATPATDRLGTIPRTGGNRVVPVTVTVPDNATPGRNTVSFTLTGTVDGKPRTVTQTQQVTVPFPSLAAAATVVGLSTNADPTGGNFDGSGFSYSADNLAAAGVTPGGTVQVGTTTTTFPAQAPGTPDAVNAAGQVVRFGGSGSALVILGSAHNGSGQGNLTVTFTDGSTATVPVSFADWFANQPTGLSSVVASSVWNPSDTPQFGAHVVGLYGEVFPIPADKTIAFLTLPNAGNMNIFSVSTANPSPNPTAPPGESFQAAADTVAVSDDSNPALGNLDGAGNSFSAQRLAALGIVPGGPVTVDGATLTFPPEAPGTPDAVAAAGQTLNLTGTGHQITLLGTADHGEVQALLQVNYSDGTNQQVFIDFNDWFDNTAAPGGSIVATSIWNQQPDNPTPHDASLYGYTVDTGATDQKTIVSVTLPNDRRLKVFSAAVHS
ncbi:MAG TPA: glycoside hydrolase family 3 C-terminal domain-containing protein [Pseudonocardiaceae bacterium]|nr:glycoside hydrolase family 3 C-terminal domain-containing protein [Pseudonocardiaceae bacterium]